jgi:hypothetical protein
MLADGMADRSHPVYLSTLKVTASAFASRHPEVTPDREGTRLLRSVLMKPEAQGYIGELHSRIEQLAAG